MRGKEIRHLIEVRFVGITPACAGKSTITAISRALKEDHPRMCGEKNAIHCKWLRCKGSPPHMRGKDPVLYLRQCLQVRPDHARHLVHLSFLRA